MSQQNTPVPQPSFQQAVPQPSFQQAMPQLSLQQAVPYLQHSMQQPSQQLTFPVPQQQQANTVPLQSSSSQLQPLQLTSPAQTSGAQFSIQQPPFSMPPKLLPVERVMMDNPSSDEASLRRLTTALAREAIFSRDALCRSSLSGKNNTSSLKKHKLDYIKAVVKSRVPNMPEVIFEGADHCFPSRARHFVQRQRRKSSAKRKDR